MHSLSQECSRAFPDFKKMILNSMSYLHCTPDLQCLPPASLCGQPSWVGPCCASSCPSCSSALWCRTKAMVDTQNVLGSCTVSSALGPGSLSPSEKKKRTLNFRSTKASPLLAYAKGCQRTFTQERGRGQHTAFQLCFASRST